MTAAPEELMLAAARIVALVLGGYLGVLLVLAGAARALGMRRSAAALLRLSPRALRPLLTTVVGVALLAPVGASARTDSHAPTPATTATTVATTTTDAPVVMRRLLDDPAPSTVTSTTAVPRTTTAPVTEMDAGRPSVLGATWTIRRGEHFWAVAKAVVTEQLGRPATNAETARYWVRLIEANRHVLRHPGNPNLLYAGQVLTLQPANR